jgi:hypothetical protein
MLKRLLTAGLLSAGLMMAQGYGSRVAGRNGGGEMDPRAKNGYSSNRFDSIANALNLNKDQKKTVRDLLEDGAKQAAPIREQMSKSRLAVGEAITANKGEDELKQVAKTSSDLNVQLSQLELKVFAKTYTTLDDTQKKDMQGLGRALALMNGMYHNKNWTDQ